MPRFLLNIFPQNPAVVLLGEGETDALAGDLDPTGEAGEVAKGSVLVALLSGDRLSFEDELRINCRIVRPR